MPGGKEFHYIPCLNDSRDVDHRAGGDRGAPSRRLADPRGLSRRTQKRPR